jgi:hypothetical protein
MAARERDEAGASPDVRGPEYILHEMLHNCPGSSQETVEYTIKTRACEVYPCKSCSSP